MHLHGVTKPVNPAEIDPERLANNPALSEQQKISEASRQFESMLLRQILSSTQKPVITSKYTDNSTASEIYRDMVTYHLADSISKSGTLGLTPIFEKQLTRLETDKTADPTHVRPEGHRSDSQEHRGPAGSKPAFAPYPKLHPGISDLSTQ
ncbi:MAG TPA: rod-binding protein [Verrucomicrobiae bacterium]|nr:rod-binding protein [Verrucomicrobiae bacterium]